jgi:hypothetical protein
VHVLVCWQGDGPLAGPGTRPCTLAPLPNQPTGGQAIDDYDAVAQRQLCKTGDVKGSKGAAAPRAAAGAWLCGCVAWGWGPVPLQL